MAYSVSAAQTNRLPMLLQKSCGVCAMSMRSRSCADSSIISLQDMIYTITGCFHLTSSYPSPVAAFFCSLF